VIFYRSGYWLSAFVAVSLIAQQPPAPAVPAAQPAPQAGAAPQATTPQQPPPTVYGGLSLNNASLTEVIDLLARQLRINYILDPRVKGGVILNTYGETKDIDTRSLLETILRINGYGMVKQGELYRIVLLTDISHLPLPLETKTDPNSIADDDQTMLNLVFLKFVTADELTNVLKPFIGENASIYTYGPANLLFILDSRRNMRRVMELVAMFDSDQLANQRVRVFEAKNGRPSDLAKELETIVRSISLSDKSAPIKFLPIDRINTLIAVAPNPGAFAEVETWLAKLDTPVRVTAGGVNNYVYRVRFGDAMAISCSITALYTQFLGVGYNNPGSILACMGTSPNGLANGAPGVGGGGIFGAGGGMYGGGGAYGANPYAANPYAANPYAANPYGGGYPYPGAYPPAAYLQPAAAAPAIAPGQAASPIAPGGVAAPAGTLPAGTDLTGAYLGAVAFTVPPRVPRVVANPLNNTLLIQATPQEYENIERLLKDLDVPPRQVLIEAKIYSVDLTHAFGSDVEAKLQTLTGTTARSFLGSLIGDTTNLTASALVGKSRELLGIVKLQESESRAKVLSAPAVVATDSIPASINVGTTVPTLAGQTASGITGAVSNAISNASTGIGLNITARVTPSGIVTMVINQNVSDPQQTTTSNIQSPSFATKSINTQVTVQDGDTIAIGGMIAETSTASSAGIPVLNRIPVFGALFGTRGYSKERTELIIFLTPHVIYDSNQMLDATDELRARIKVLRKDVKE
jgi:general secretion pathway protein D